MNAKVLDPSARAVGSDRMTTLARRSRHLWVGVPPTVFALGCGVALFALMAVLGYAVSKVLVDDGLGHADAGLARWFAEHRTPALDAVTGVLTGAGGTMTIVALAAVSVIGAALAWRRWREPMLVVVAIAGEVTIFLLTTMVVDRTRPPVPQLDQAPPTSSFPSGHTAAAICMYGALAVLANERARSAVVRWAFLAFAIVMPVLVALSRMYRGMHYLTDVLGAALLAILWLTVSVLTIRLGVEHAELLTPRNRGRRR